MFHYKGTYDKSHFGANGQQGNVANAHQTAYAAFDKTVGSFAQTQAAAAAAAASTTYAAPQSSAAVPATQGFGYNFPKAAPGGKDLWNERPNGTHGGITPHTGPQAPSTIQHEAAPSDFAFGGAAGANANALGNTGNLGAGARPQYHVPGYSGFVRGEQFRFGDTYGKSTRMALNVPTDLPLEP